MVKMKSLWLILTWFYFLTFLPAWGGGVLELYDDEIETHSFRRPYTITHGFFLENKEDVEKLVGTGFFGRVPLSEKARGEVQGLLYNISQNSKPTLVVSYGKDLGALLTDLRQVKKHFNKGKDCIDLNLDEKTFFTRELNALIKITRYLSPFAGLRE